jgi:hypothetical protein
MSQITPSKTALFSILQSAADADDGWPDKPGPFGPIIRERRGVQRAAAGIFCRSVRSAAQDGVAANGTVGTRVSIT